MQPIPVIIGPTAGGKSALAMALARRRADLGRNAEIISADAFQVYRRMDIGTAKPPPADRAAIPHHLIDIRDPDEPFSADDWLRLAEATISEIRSRGADPILVGGTHLYIKAFLEGMFEGPPPDEILRAALAARPATDLRAELERVDPAAAARIHPNDRRRTTRALEVFHQTGTPISTLQTQWDTRRRADARLVVLDWPAEEINRRINARVRDMISRGLADEARELWQSDALGPQAREALGYKQLIHHFEGAGTPEDAIERIKIESRRYAKNQRTWLRRLAAAPPGSPPTLTINAADPNAVSETVSLLGICTG